jgi:hypothetical protein
MDDMFARETGDVGTGTSYIFSLNNDRSHALFGQRPGEVLARFAAAQHDDIIFFRVMLYESTKPMQTDAGLRV